jgi:hypothetical protein
MNSKIYQLKIELLGIKPPIWRRIKVDGKTTFSELHMIIQIVMGWKNGHLFEFENNELRISDDTEPDFFGSGEAKASDEITIEEVLKRKVSKIKYTYDFGDNWEHLITAEETEKGELPDGAICIKGKRNCPPEDCGGIWGYRESLSIINDPEHPDYEDTIEWMDEEFDPEYFDLEKTNEILASYYG